VNALKERPVPLRALWLVIFFCTLPLVVTATEWPASRELRDLQLRSAASLHQPASFADWQILWSPALDAAVLGLGSPVSVGSKADPQGLLSPVLAATGTQAQFEMIQQVTTHKITHTGYRELRDKLPVLGGSADVVLNARGQMIRWGVQAHDCWPVVDSHLLDMATAAAALSATLRPAAWKLETTHSYAAWFPDYDSHKLRPAYRVVVSGNHPYERWEGVVDAVSGEIILDWPGFQTDNISGTISGPYWQPYIQSPVQTAPQAFEGVFINGEEEDTTDADGAFTHPVGDSAQLYTPLAGNYVHVFLPDETTHSMTATYYAPYSPLTWTWEVGTNGVTAAELNIYHHINRVHAWYKSLDSAFTGLDYQVPAVANFTEPGYIDNAMWAGSGCIFGAGDVYRNFGMFSDVIYHEYTHGVTGAIYASNPLPYSGQPGALNEAISDYIGCTMNGDPYMAEYIGGSFGSWFRNLLQTHVFPQDWSGEVHDDSRFVSEALWTIRTALGATATDDLVHFARYEQPQSFLPFMLAVMDMDDDDGNPSNGTPHGQVIYDAFQAHGIAPSDTPTFAMVNVRTHADGSGGSVGNGDRYFEAGETVELAFDLTNQGFLYGPPATGVVVTVAPTNPDITVENGVVSLAELMAMDTLPLAPVLLHISAAAADQWTKISIYITANNGTVTQFDSLEWMIGKPHVLVVEDDPGSDVVHYIRDRLHLQNRIFDRTVSSATAALTDSLLPRPGVILWLSGNARGEILTPADRVLLRNYLADGNRIVLSGQNLLDNLAGTSFLEDTLGVSIASDSVPRLTSRVIYGAAAPFASGDTLLLLGGTGAGNQQSMTSFTLRGDSRLLARYGSTPTSPISAVEGAAGRALLLGFGIEAVSGAGTSVSLGGVLDRIYTWASDVILTTPQPHKPALLPTVATLGPAYPNPFNSSTNLSYALPTVRNARLTVYDVLGRMVDNQSIPTGTHTLQWSPALASGVYFARIRWDGGQTQPVKLLLLR
jgi:hypothetical protein